MVNRRNPLALFSVLPKVKEWTKVQAGIPTLSLATSFMELELGTAVLGALMQSAEDGVEGLSDIYTSSDSKTGTVSS